MLRIVFAKYRCILLCLFCTLVRLV